MDIGASIKKLRIKKSITQHQLAEYLNVSMQTISRWETSVTYPDIVMLPILAKYFHVTVDYLLNSGGNVMKTIESNRLLVREWSESDATDLFELKQKSNNFIDYLNFSIVDDTLDSIKIWKEYQEMYPVILKETGKLIGVVGLVDINRYKGIEN
ncbi:helix-turn-helix domain-containing protein [Anaerocolumna sedimenticola]|uniref:Helix-turn-helix domain-containing protein n=1 Tax=Anaerocolumna sedimenticola TaxID=2696063 RepID=A0A6P1TRN5_9FIRM|nr:helix-turn-helix domain-containing protein [Anaerocolumna sedimenticola]QHQ62919.1 helix-turn-helix domain-containing protein [Anaerocolumna sedimenticola]